MLFLDKTPDLTDAEYNIYKYISSNIDTVCYMRVRDLSLETHTSTTSILRFCNKFKCDGFSEFKVKLKIYQETAAPKKNFAIDQTTQINFLNRTTQPFFRSKIDEAVALLKDKELILFIGVGSSNIMAEYGALYFSSIFNLALRIEDTLNHPINFLSQSLSKKLCVIALSVSGETSEVIDYLSHINFGSSSIISITNSENSTIAKLSDVNIPYYINTETNQGADITSQLPTLYTLELIAKEVHAIKETTV